MESKKDVYQIVTDKILEELDKGNVPWRRPWITQGAAPANFVSKKHYQGINVILLGMQGYSCPYWLTFKQATELKGAVKKGEKGSTVVFWKIIDRETDTEDPEETTGKKVFFLRYYTVFNLLQTSLADRWQPESLPGQHIEPDRTFKNYTEREKIPVTLGGDRAFYHPAQDSITLPVPEAYKDPAEFHSTAFHESVHSTGHEKRLKRFMAKEAASGESYGAEELVAEIGAAILCNLCNVDTEPAFSNSVAYIQTWKEKIRADKKLVVTAASKAQKAVDFITG